MSRRGSRITQAENGTWGFIVDIAPPGAPRRQTRRRGFATKTAAQRELTRILASLDQGTFVGRDRMTLAGYLDGWLDGLVVAGHRRSTLESYRRNVRLHVVPSLGAARLQALGPLDLDRLYARLLASGRVDGKGGLSARAVRYIHTIVGKALADAERKGLVVRNVARAATPPSAKAARAPEMKFWAPATLAAFLAFVADDDLFPLLRLAAMSGMRLGEVCGLRWEDVDLDGGQVDVRRQLSMLDTELIFSEHPKSDHGRRTVTVDGATVTALRGQRVRQATWHLAVGPGWRGDGLVFTGPAGDPLNPKQVSRAFVRRARWAGAPRIRFHDLRHTHCAHLIAAGINVKAVSKRMGHASVSFTLDRYGHLLPEADQVAAEAVAELVDGTVTTS